jgi:hypothetical protein
MDPELRKENYGVVVIIRHGNINIPIPPGRWVLGGNIFMF